jgi:putative acetyltransferase
MEIRAATVADRDPIWDLHATSFPTHAEADLVNRLNGDGDVIYSVVAEFDGMIVGHVLYSKMQSPEGFLGLAPVAVHSEHRRQGIADALVRKGLELAKEDGWLSVFVLGDNYYERFGFEAKSTEAFTSPYAGPHFMALSLQPDGLKDRSGQAEYPRAFAELG